MIATPGYSWARRNRFTANPQRKGPSPLAIYSVPAVTRLSRGFSKTRGHNNAQIRGLSATPRLGRTSVVLSGVIGLFVAAAGMSIDAGSAAAATTWSTPIQVGAPNLEGGTFTSVSCVDATNCTAVGYETNTNTSEPIYDIETNGEWGSPVQLDTPYASPAYLYGVSCSTAANCTAVGSTAVTNDIENRGHQPIYVTETNGVWGSFIEVQGQDTTNNSFNAISCSNATNCTAVGSDVVSPGGTVAIDATETNGVWGALNGPFVGILSSVSCTSPGNCTAVGTDQNADYSPGWITETNGLWSAVTPFPGTTPTGIPLLQFGPSSLGVSCTGVKECTAVGTASSGTAPVYATESDGSWSTFSDIPGSAGGSGSFAGVSCTGVGTCTAVGTDANEQPVVDTETNGTWGPPTEVLGATGGSGSFTAISCSEADRCTAVGADGKGFPIYSVSTPQSPPTFSASADGTSSVTVSWTNVTPTQLARNGTDVTGAGTWNTGQLTNQPSSGSFTFQNLVPGETYTFTLYDDKITNTGTGPLTLTAQATTSTPPPTTTTPPPTTTTPPVVTSPTTTNGHGYWLVGSDGGIFTFGSAQFYGSTGNIVLNKPVVGITPASNDEGYWLVASDGGIFTFGNLAFYGSIPGLGISPAGSGAPRSLNAPIVGMVPSADGGGYFMVGADGGVFAFGDAKFEGSCPGIGGCSGAAVAVMPDATGNGYWLVTATGNVYAFGDAINHGAPGPQAVPVTAAVRTTDGGGYWILFSNGVVAPYGDAVNLGGPVGSVGGFNPATTIFTTSDGGGYWVSSANGSVFTQGDAPFEGSMGGVHLNGSIIAATGW